VLCSLLYYVCLVPFAVGLLDTWISSRCGWFPGCVAACGFCVGRLMSFCFLHAYGLCLRLKCFYIELGKTI
jgi:hypothetical protein